MSNDALNPLKPPSPHLHPKATTRTFFVCKIQLWDILALISIVKTHEIVREKKEKKKKRVMHCLSYFLFHKSPFIKSGLFRVLIVNTWQGTMLIGFLVQLTLLLPLLPSCVNHTPDWTVKNTRPLCMSVCLSVRPSICLCICLSVFLSVRPSICLSIPSSIHPSIYLPTHLRLTGQ